MRPVLSVLAVAALLGCESPVAPDMVPFDPPAHYATIYAQTAQCGGVAVPFGEIRWYRAPLERPTIELTRGTTVILATRLEAGSLLEMQTVAHAGLHVRGFTHGDTINNPAFWTDCWWNGD